MKRRKIIGIIIGIVVVLSLFSLCTNDTTIDENTVEDEVSEEQIVLFEDDEVVNDFFVEYQNISNTEFKDFSSNRKYKCYAENSGYWFEVGHYTPTSQLGIMIEQTNDTAEAGVEGMRDVFYYTVKTLDNTLSDEEIYEVFDNREDKQYKATLNKLNIEIYPDLELSSGHSRGNIQIDKTLDE